MRASSPTAVRGATLTVQCWVMTRLFFATLLSCLGCEASVTPPGVLELGADYVQSASARRAAFEASLVNPGNGYAQLRARRYTEEDWGALPLWNPPARPMVVGETRPETLEDGTSLAYEGIEWSREALIALGRRAFFLYPVQIAPSLVHAIDDPERYGMSVHEDRMDAAVWTETEGGVFPSLTCASCHADRADGGELVAGKTNRRFDYGRLLDDFYQTRSARGEWGPARVDVTPDDLSNPTVATDLRPVAYQRHIHRAATLHNDPIALAIRLETLLITASGQAVGPPREITFALSLYLWSMAEALPPIPTDGPGRVVYDRVCASCHGGAGLVGEPVALEQVGTDPAIGASRMRGTGTYRVPSLRGVGDRSPLLAAGGVPDLATLLDPERATLGHTYGFELDPRDRADLLAFLRAL